MSSQRRSILDKPPQLDTSGFTPKTTTDASAPKAEAIRAVAESVNFTSRESAPQPEERTTTSIRREQRRYRSGRNIQVSVKASREVAEAFYAMADKNGWLVAVTFEKAVAALQRETDREDGRISG